MILKAEAVADLLSSSDEKDPLVITPQPNLSTLRHSGSASVDLRLGTWFLTLRQARMSHLSVGDNSGDLQLTKMQYVPFGKEYYLHPQSFALGVTLEWIRIPANLAGYVTSKSSWGRRGLIIATATGIHPGFKGCLTLELSNLGEIPIAIKPGMTVCQLFLHTVQSTQTFVDKSRFNGLRKPALGKIEMDEVAKKLSDADIEKLFEQDK